MITLLRLLVVLFTVWNATAAGAFLPSENTGGARGDGVADDTAALQRVLDSGGTVVLGAGKTYRITRRLDITRDGSGILGDGTATLLMGAGAGAFDNAAPEKKYAPNATAILATNVVGVRIEGLRIRYGTQIDDRHVKAMALRGCRDFRIAGNDISNFSLADGIVYVGASQDGVITGNAIHSSHTNSKTRGQISGIVLDDDDKGSSRIEISGNHIYDLTVGPEFFAKFNAQTDGINLTMRTAHVDVTGNRIENVGEGIDSFATDTTIVRNRIVNARAFGIKLFHGASRTVVRRNDIVDAGIGGIVIGGAAAGLRDSADNVIEGNRIRGVNRDGGAGRFTTFGIGILRGKPGATRVVRTRIMGNDIELGGNALFGVLAESGSGNDNEVSGNSISGSSRESYRLDPVTVPRALTGAE
ncbi:right-handed parallel beta-helix repeat-containing protein [Aestuariivirga sp.]|uniref:right-handed parallel beta-helix repeat-containing protein n=1 Tax=Aestuariivirga sp. TaxID=2650926 RepID=UPI00359450EC